MGMLKRWLPASGGGTRLLHTSAAVGEQAGGEQAEGAPDRKTSSYRGVDWHKDSLAWRAWLWDPKTKRLKNIGTYTSEEDAARAYDYAAVEMHGPECTDRNFPDEVVSEPPVSLGDEMRERKTSDFIGVCWHTGVLAWQVQLWDPQAKRRQHIGTYASEEDAARAYDYATVKMHGPGYTKRNFPDEVISEPPAARGRKPRRER
ncbi:hypothetical protein FOA52_011618 [Chlamydomonas sp. UWO 241]|nr:hypothetical protein FOA52_011618 [Chlamydomonas sp. UWO 241]